MFFSFLTLLIKEHIQRGRCDYTFGKRKVNRKEKRMRDRKEKYVKHLFLEFICFKTEDKLVHLDPVVIFFIFLIVFNKESFNVNIIEAFVPYFFSLWHGRGI